MLARMKTKLAWVNLLLLVHVGARGTEPTAENRFHVDLPPNAFAHKLLADSPYGVNTAWEP
jgi:hypothetical protein